jgi:hypothetical protein
MKLKLTVLLSVCLAFFILPTVSYAQNDTGRLYPVIQNGKWGYIDKTGKIVIKPRFGGADEFSEGPAEIELNGKWGFIDRTGAIIIKSQFDVTAPFSQGIAGIVINKKVGFIDKSGRFVVKPQFEWGGFGGFDEEMGLAMVSMGGDTIRRAADALAAHVRHNLKEPETTNELVNGLGSDVGLLASWGAGRGP